MNTPKLIRWLSALALATALNFTAPAQVRSYTGGTLGENVNHLATTGTTTPQ